jgi:hypothetical protein
MLEVPEALTRFGRSTGSAPTATGDEGGGGWRPLSRRTSDERTDRYY